MGEMLAYSIRGEERPAEVLVEGECQRAFARASIAGKSIAPVSLCWSGVLLICMSHLSFASPSPTGPVGGLKNLHVGLTSRCPLW
jgi:hypothetical protein